MNNDIVKLIEASEEIRVEDKKLNELEFGILKGEYNKWYLMYDAKNEIDQEEILKIIEQVCLNNEILKEISPQFIYAIILCEVTDVNESTYKKIIQVEEDEYFCKKYVLYYKKEEVECLSSWLERIKTSNFNKALNNEGNIELMKLNDNSLEKKAINLLMRIIIKCPFINFEFLNKGVSDFSVELEKVINVMRPKEKKDRVIKYRDSIFEKINNDNIDDMVSLFIKEVREEK